MCGGPWITSNEPVARPVAISNAILRTGQKGHSGRIDALRSVGLIVCISTCYTSCLSSSGSDIATRRFQLYQISWGFHYRDLQTVTPSLSYPVYVYIRSLTDDPTH